MNIFYIKKNGIKHKHLLKYEAFIRSILYKTLLNEEREARSKGNEQLWTANMSHILCQMTVYNLEFTE